MQNEKDFKPLSYLHDFLGIKNVHADHAASHLGKSYGLIKLLLGAPHQGLRGKVYLPMDIMAKVRQTIHLSNTALFSEPGRMSGELMSYPWCRRWCRRRRPCRRVCVNKNFNLGHNFFPRSDRAFILHMCIHCDKTFHMVQMYHNF